MLKEHDELVVSKPCQYSLTLLSFLDCSHFVTTATTWASSSSTNCSFVLTSWSACVSSFLNLGLATILCLQQTIVWMPFPSISKSEGIALCSEWPYRTYCMQEYSPVQVELFFLGLKLANKLQIQYSLHCRYKARVPGRASIAGSKALLPASPANPHLIWVEDRARIILLLPFPKNRGF